MRPEAHLLALVLVALDLLARTVRIREVMRTAGVALAWRDAVCLNAWSDAASSLTPMRLGGEPARYLALRVFQVPVRPALGGLALEMAIATPVTALIGLALAWQFGAAWLMTLRSSSWLGPVGIVAGVLLVLVVPGLTVWRRRLSPETVVARPRATGLAILVAGATTVASVMSRVAVLPVLMRSALPVGDMEVTLLGSFVLLFGQVMVPLPAGAGVVDAAFLGGLAGVTAAATLIAWRFYTTVIGVILGGALLAWRGLPLAGLFGSGGLRGMLFKARNLGVVAEKVIEDRTPSPAEGGRAGTPAQAGAQHGVGQ